jgi:hypothetical protein
MVVSPALCQIDDTFNIALISGLLEFLNIFLCVSHSTAGYQLWVPGPHASRASHRIVLEKMSRLIYGLGGATALALAGVTTEHYWSRKSWRDSHPLVTGSMDLLLKDGKVLATIGYPLEYREKVNGIFDTDKTWCNFNYEIAGPHGLAKVSVLADSKILEDSPKDAEEFVMEGPVAYGSVFSTVKNLVTGQTAEERPPHWRILSMYIRVGDNDSSYTLIGDDEKTHRELHNSKYIESLEGFEPIEKKEMEKEKSDKLKDRRMETYKKVRTRWMYMASVGGSIALVGWIIRRMYYRTALAANSVFFNTAMDILKQDPALVSRLGNPINNLLVRGYYNLNLSGGEFSTIVYGSKSSGLLKGKGKSDKKTNKWQFSELALQTESEAIDLLKK